MNNNDTDSPDYCDHNLGDERETPEEKEISRLQTELAHLRAESLRLVSANDALESVVATLQETCAHYEERLKVSEPVVATLQAERDGLREALEKELDDSFNLAECGLATEKLSGNVVKAEYWKGELATIHRLRIILSTPPTAALPDGEALLDWLEANKERIFCLAWEPRDNEWRISANPTDSFSGAEILAEASTIREAIRSARAAITGATPATGGEQVETVPTELRMCTTCAKAVSYPRWNGCAGLEPCLPCPENWRKLKLVKPITGATP